MKFSVTTFLLILILSYFHTSNAIPVDAGFSLPDNVSEVTFRFKSIRNLLLLPVTINDSITVNLILDTGCRNLVLFGEQFEERFLTEVNRKIQFSGLGDGAPVSGKLSIDNKVSIHTLIGEKIPVVIIPDQNLFSKYSNVHGLIGYDIFIKFEIEFTMATKMITFRPAATSEISPEYNKLDMRIEDSRPLIHSKVFFSTEDGQPCDLMLDTGSAFGLLVKTTDLKKFSKSKTKKILGRGLNGNVEGIELTAKKLLLNSFELHGVGAGIIFSSWHSYASIGMDVMKDFTVVLNYCKSYAGFKKS